MFYNLGMFFRRQPAVEVNFEERVERLKGSGFVSRPLDSGRLEVSRQGCGAVIVRPTDGVPAVERVGVLVRGEIASLVDGGYQKFLQTPSGLRRPALSTELKALHDFQEDLDEALGLESLYNESLGTVCNRHVYDRLTGRP